jgi:hypothetical protein
MIDPGRTGDALLLPRRQVSMAGEKSGDMAIET